MSHPKRNMGGLIVIFFLQLFCLALTPEVRKQVRVLSGIGGANLTGAARALALIGPLLWFMLVIGLMIAGILVFLQR